MLPPKNVPQLHAWALLVATLVAATPAARAAWSCSDVSAPQCAALDALYTTFGVAAWAAESAAPTVAACKLPGVTCASAAITALALPASKLNGTLPQELSALSALRTLDLSNNILYGPMPAQWAALTALVSLNLSVNAVSGTLPAFLGESVALQDLSLRENFFAGTVPEAFGRPWRTLVLDTNLLSPAALPPALCPLACQWQSAFVTSNTSSPCGCTLSATYAQCPLPNLPTATFAPVGPACILTSPLLVCTACLASIMNIIGSQGIILTNNEILGCIRVYSPSYLAAGANPDALRATAKCGEVLGYDNFAPVAAGATCNLPPPSAMLALAASCTRMQTLCTVCSSQLFLTFLPGVEVSALTRSDVFRVRSCAFSNVAIFLNVIPINILDALQSCPLPPPSQTTVAVLLVGAAAADVEAARFVAAICVALGISTSACAEVPAPAVTSVVDAVAPAGGALSVVNASAARLACTVTFTLSGDSLALATASAAALAAAAQSGALLLALRNQGRLPYLAAVSMLARPTGTLGTAASKPRWSRERTVVAAVVASVGGAGLFVLGVAMAARRRQRRRLAREGWGGSSEDGAPKAAPALSPSGGWSALVCNASEVVLGDVLGYGGFATVHSAQWRGTPVAVKVFSALPFSNLIEVEVTLASIVARDTGAKKLGNQAATAPTLMAKEESFLREVAILSSLRHPNVMAVFALIKQPPMLVLELAAIGSLRDLLARTTLSQLPWLQRASVLRGVAAGVEFLHAQQPPIIHMDLKSGNIVLADGLIPKVCDLGVGITSLQDHHSGNQHFVKGGTPMYMAPECLRQEPIFNFPALDCYGFGWIMHDVAHCNTDAGAAARLRATGVEPSIVAACPSVSSSSAGDSGLFASGECGVASVDARSATPLVGVLLRRELASYSVDIGAQVPPNLAQLIRACLALDPQARPSLTAMREGLGAAAFDARGWE